MSKVDFDLSGGNAWGRAVYGDRTNKDGTVAVSGCLSPLPMVGSTVKDVSGAIWRFKSVRPMGDPRDGFFGELEPADQQAEDLLSARTQGAAS